MQTQVGAVYLLAPKKTAGSRVMGCPRESESTVGNQVGSV